MGTAEDGPDFEVLVDAAKKSQIPDVLSVTEVHTGGAVAADRVKVASAQPAPATVVRAMATGSGPVEVDSASGAWLVDPRTGRISRP